MLDLKEYLYSDLFGNSWSGNTNKIFEEWLKFISVRLHDLGQTRYSKGDSVTSNAFLT